MTLGEKLKTARKAVGVFFAFGLPELIHGVNHLDKEFYLVTKVDRKYLVMVTDEFIESRQIAREVTQKKFEIGDFSFTDCGSILYT